MGGGDAEYHRDYYRRKRTSLLAKRRKRYRTDAEYRELVKTRARDRHRRLRKKADSGAGGLVKSVGSEYFTVSKVATEIGLSPNTIRAYHRKGIIPVPTVSKETGKYGWNLYSKKQILLLKRVFRRFKDPEDSAVRSLIDVKRLLEKEWLNDSTGKTKA